jgi:hypothetical protein
MGLKMSHRNFRKRTRSSLLVVTEKVENMPPDPVADPRGVTVAMAKFGMPRRIPDHARANAPAEVNWRRGLFRVWLLLSAAWIICWTLYWLLYGIQVGFQNISGVLAIPVLLFIPPIVLLLLGWATGWAFRGFRPGHDGRGDDTLDHDRQ